MDTKIKNYVGIALIIGILVAAVSLWGFVGAYEKQIEPASFRSFTVSGEGEVIAVPDVAQFSFTVLTEGGKDIAELQEENTEKINEAIAFVKKEGVDAKDIRTEGYNVNPRYQYYNCSRPVLYGDDEVEPCPPPEIVGYTIRQTVSVKIRDFSDIGKILSGVVENGANTVSQLNFTIDDPTEVENRARAEAIKKAQEKAEAIADAGDFSLGQLLSISEGGGYYPTPRVYMSMDMAGKGGSSEESAVPAIEPGSQEVTVRVTLKYEIR